MGERPAAEERMAATTGTQDESYGGLNLEEVQDVFEATVGRGEAPNSLFNLVHKKDDSNAREQERTPSMPSCSTTKNQEAPPLVMGYGGSQMTSQEFQIMHSII